MMNTMAYVWLALVVVFSVVEGATAGLVSVWFAGGSIASFIAALAGGGVLLQLVLFVVVSAVLVACLRPLARRKWTVNTIRTNADRVLGQLAVVTEDIDNLTATGAVRVAGVEWTARSQSDAPIAAGETVKILRIDGVKLYVEPAAVPAEA